MFTCTWAQKVYSVKMNGCKRKAETTTVLLNTLPLQKSLDLAADPLYRALVQTASNRGRSCKSCSCLTVVKAKSSSVLMKGNFISMGSISHPIWLGTIGLSEFVTFPVLSLPLYGWSEKEVRVRCPKPWSLSIGLLNCPFSSCLSLPTS